MRNSKIFSLITFDVFDFAKSVKESFVITFNPEKFTESAPKYSKVLIIENGHDSLIFHAILPNQKPKCPKLSKESFVFMFNPKKITESALKCLKVLNIENGHYSLIFHSI